MCVCFSVLCLLETNRAVFFFREHSTNPKLNRRQLLVVMIFCRQSTDPPSVKELVLAEYCSPRVWVLWNRGCCSSAVFSQHKHCMLWQRAVESQPEMVAMTDHGISHCVWMPAEKDKFLEISVRSFVAVAYSIVGVRQRWTGGVHHRSTEQFACKLRVEKVFSGSVFNLFYAFYILNFNLFNLIFFYMWRSICSEI